MHWYNQAQNDDLRTFAAEMGFVQSPWVLRPPFPIFFCSYLRPITVHLYVSKLVSNHEFLRMQAYAQAASAEARPAPG